MKFSELKELTVDEIEQKIEAAEKQLFENRLKLKIRQFENTAAFSRLRHEIAQLKTILRQRQLTQASGGQ